jgi:hypothetical protein
VGTNLCQVFSPKYNCNTVLRPPMSITRHDPCTEYSRSSSPTNYLYGGHQYFCGDVVVDEE